MVARRLMTKACACCAWNTRAQPFVSRLHLCCKFWRCKPCIMQSGLVSITSKIFYGYLEVKGKITFVGKKGKKLVLEMASSNTRLLIGCGIAFAFSLIVLLIGIFTMQRAISYVCLAIMLIANVAGIVAMRKSSSSTS